MPGMVEFYLWWSLAAFVFVLVVGVLVYIVARWVFVEAADKIATEVNRRVGGAAARKFTRLAAYGLATGISIDEANWFFGARIDRLAKLMDSAIQLPIVGKIGLDAVFGFVPVVGDLAGTAVSLTLIARTLRYGPPAELVVRMLSNVVIDLVLGSIPFIGVIADIWFKSNDRNSALMQAFVDGRS